MSIYNDLLGSIFSMDLIDVRTDNNKVTYVYRTTCLIASKKLQEIKAKLMSILSFPADIPIDVRIIPIKRGILIKGYLVEVDVPYRGYKFG